MATPGEDLKYANVLHSECFCIIRASQMLEPTQRCVLPGIGPSGIAPAYFG